MILKEKLQFEKFTEKVSLDYVVVKDANPESFVSRICVSRVDRLRKNACSHRLSANLVK